MNIQRILTFSFSTICFIFLSGCMEKDIPVTLSGELIDKGILMNSSSTKDSTVEIYLVSEEAIDGELLAKAMNVSGLEIARAKVVMNLQKDDAKLFTFNFDSGIDTSLIAKYRIDLRKN